MTDTATTDDVLQALVQRFDAAAHAASVAEEDYRREATVRVKALERARSFAFRRLNLLKSVIAAMAGVEDEKEAETQAMAVFFREVNWNGASESQREVARRFLPVVNLLWLMRQDTRVTDIEAVEREFAAFETWFAENRNGPFLALMDGEVLELPLVEV